ncbi:Acidic mammalian chitinase [Lamellibrachia satsuma]|nr:Acidic mammalian chitinase [Lamellibrachia satsuma]
MVMAMIACFCCCVLVAYTSLVRAQFNNAIHFRRVCVFRNWLHWYDYPRAHRVEDIDASLCSHIVYDGVGLEHNRLVTHDLNDEDSNRGVGQIKKLLDIRKKEKSLKVVVSLGGSHFQWRYLSDMMTSSANRATFLGTIISYIRTRRFDGFHLDFPFPRESNNPRAERKGFTMLVTELRQIFERESNRTGRPRLELSASVSCDRRVVERSYDIIEISYQLDWISLRAFDFDGDNEGMTFHQAPLYEDDRKANKPLEHNIKWAVNYWLDAGLDESRLVVGISFNGAAYELKDGRVLGFWAPQTGAAPEGKYTKKEGRLSYYEVCEYLNKGAPRMWDSTGEVPYAIYDGWLWMAYDNDRSLSIKLSWIRASHLGGWMAWHFASDDFHGTFCCQGKYPLLRTLNGYNVPKYGGGCEQTSGGVTISLDPRLLPVTVYAVMMLVFAFDSVDPLLDTERGS